MDKVHVISKVSKDLLGNPTLVFCGSPFGSMWQVNRVYLFGNAEELKRAVMRLQAEGESFTINSLTMDYVEKFIDGKSVRGNK